MRALRAVLALALLSAAAADTTPPNFSAGYPSVTAVTGSQFTLNVKSNEAGKAYYYVVAGASPTPPTPAQLEAQYASAYGAVTIFAKGEITLTAADTAYDVDVTGLSENTVYSVFVVAEDDQATPNLQTAVTDLDVTTADDTAPSFATGFPKATEIKDTEFKLVVELNEPGLFHWAVLPTTAAAPSASEMENSNNANAVAKSAAAGVAVTAGALQKTVTVTGLAEATTYDVYVLARDDNGDLGGGQTDNVQSSIHTFTVATADVTPPAFESTFPSIPSASVSTSALNISVQLDEPGTVYYYLVKAQDTPPTAAQVTAQTATYGDVVVVAKGTVVVAAASTQVDTLVSGLDDLTAYSAYVVPADGGMTSTATNAYYTTAANVATTATRVNSTTADGTPPVFVGAYTPTTSEIDGTSFDIDVQLDEPGTVYYIVVPRTTDEPPATPPTAAQTKTGDFTGTTACGSFAVASATTNVTESVTVASDLTISACADHGNGQTPGSGGSGVCSACPLIESEKRYWVYLVAEDDETSPNAQTAPRRLNVTTTDVTPPSFRNETASTAAVYVSANVAATYAYRPNLGGVQLEVTTSLDEPGTVYYLAALATDGAPTVAEVKACGASRDGDRADVGAYTYTPSGGSATAPLACGHKHFLTAQTETKYVLKGMPSETAVKVYVAAEDFEDQRLPHAGLKTNPPASNFQTSVSDVSATTADITPPTFATVASVAYPRVAFAASGDVTHDKASLEFALDEPGVVHYVVLTRDQKFHAGYTDGTERQTPSAAEIRAGTGPGGVSAADAASVNVTAADTVVAVDTTAAALSAGTKYDVYVVAEDDFSPANRQGDEKVVKLQFSTRDNAAPVFASGFPSAVTGGVGVEMTVKLDEPGKAYFVVVARGAMAPTADEVVLGADYSGVTVVAKCAAFDVPAASTPAACSATGLTEATDYDVYVAADDVVDVALDGGRPYPSANRVLDPNAPVQITTADTTPPAFGASSPAVTSLGSDGTSFDFTVNVDEAGTAWYVVDLQSAGDPSAENVRKGVSATGGAVAAAGYKAVASGDINSDVTAAVANQRLSSETAYYLHVAAEDAASSPNLASSASRVAFTTPDVTPPTFVGRYTKRGAISDVGAETFDLTVALSEPGSVYYVVVEKGDSPSITAADVRNLRGGAVGAARTVFACGAFDVAAADTNVTVTVAKDLSDASCSGFTGPDPDSDVINVASHPGLPALSAGALATYVPQCATCPVLRSDTEYDVYIVAEDDGAHASPSAAFTDARNLQASATKVSTPFHPSSASVASLRTADNTAPAWHGDAPHATNFFGDGFDVSVALDEPGVVHFLVVANHSDFACSAAPTNAQVKAGLNGCANATATKTFGSISVPSASAFVTKTVSGLDATRFKDPYVVWAFAEDLEPSGMSSLTSPNAQAAPTSFAAETVDTQPPLFASGYPQANNPVSATGFGAVTTKFDVVAKLDEPGKVYYVAFPASDASDANKGSGLPGSRAPSPAQVRAGQDYSGAAATVAGSFDVADTSATTTTTTGAMTDGTTYDVYVVAEDAAADENRTLAYVAAGGAAPADNLSPVYKTSVTTADGTAPLFSASYPKLEACSASGFTLKVKVDKAGSTVHYTVVGYADLAAIKAQSDPTNEEVSLGTSPYTPALTSSAITPLKTGSVSCANADTEYSASVTGVGATGFYQVFVTVEGPNGNLGDGDVQRTANENPTKLAPCVAPQSGDLITWTATDTSLKADVFLSAPAVVHYVLLKHDAPAPTPAQVLLGVDASGNAPPCFDCDFADTSSSAVAGNTSCAHDGATIWDTTGCTLETFGNLTNAAEYDLYLVTTHSNATAVASDNTGPDGSSVYYAEVSRAVVGPATGRATDSVAPLFSASYPKLVDVKATTATLAAKLNEAGKVWYAVLEGGDATTVTPDLVKLGTDSSFLLKGSSSNVAAETDIAFALTGLESKKTYDAYLVAMDDEDGGNYGGNLQAAVTKRTFTAASADGHLGGVAAQTVTAAAGDKGEQTTLHAVQPAFDPEIFEYRTFVNVTTASVKVTLTANDTQSDGLITVNGTSRAGGVAFDVPLAHGITVLAVAVVSGDGTTTKTYTYKITRASDDTVTNATLSFLEVTLDDGVVLNSTHLGGAAWPRCVKGCDANSRARCSTANPECVMDAARTNYVAPVPMRVASISIAATATRAASGAVVRIFTKGHTNKVGLGDVLSDSTRNVSLTELSAIGGDRVLLVVTAGDGVGKRTYTIDFERVGPGVYGEGFAPPTASGIAGASYGSDDALTVRAGTDPTVRDLTVIPKLDLVAPSFVESFPRVTSQTSATIEMAVQLTEPGVVYYLVVPDGARAPTSREVKEARELRPAEFMVASSVVAGNITSLKSLTAETTAVVDYGVAASTAYDVWFVAEDDARDYNLNAKPNLQAAPSKLDVTTAS